MTLSTVSNASLEEVAHATPNSPKFFQLYIYKNRDLTRQLVQRAERAGYRALVLTVDTPLFGQRFSMERNPFHLPAHLKLGNIGGDDHEEDSKKDLGQYVNSLFDPSISWKDIHWLRSITKLPIIAKGILTREDALLALKHGCAAIWVSNHGGRQLDSVPATVSCFKYCLLL